MEGVPETQKAEQLPEELGEGPVSKGEQLDPNRNKETSFVLISAPREK